MTALSDLIARLEAAPEGSRELDAEVWAKVNGLEGEITAGWKLARWCWNVGSIGLWDDELPHYTTSLDAALPGESVILSRRTDSGNWAALHSRGDGAGSIEGVGRTEALARRIAALKAREAL